jgi:hypothetical protein
MSNSGPPVFSVRKLGQQWQAFALTADGWERVATLAEPRTDPLDLIARAAGAERHRREKPVRHNEDITVPMLSIEELEVRWQEDRIRTHLKEIEKKVTRMGKELDLNRASMTPAMKDVLVEHCDNITGLLRQMIEVASNRDHAER